MSQGTAHISNPHESEEEGIHAKRPSFLGMAFYINKSRTVDMNKLRMTGFERLAAFVIRRAKHTPKGAARHWRQKPLSRN